MSSVAPKGRKHLSADALLRMVRRGFATMPDARGGATEIALPDALMSAFAMCSLKSPALLAFDKQRVEGHVGTIYGMGHVPCETQRRERLDPVSPAALRPLFKRVFRPLQRGKALEPMTYLDGHDVWSRDGTGYFSSQTMHCASCLHTTHRNGSVT